MYLHIGQNVIVKDSAVIGIFDLDITTQSHITRAYLTKAEKSGYVENAADDIPRSFVVCSERDKNKVYLSQLSSDTLKKRSENFSFE